MPHASTRRDWTPRRRGLSSATVRRPRIVRGGAGTGGWKAWIASAELLFFPPPECHRFGAVIPGGPYVMGVNGGWESRGSRGRALIEGSISRRCAGNRSGVAEARTSRDAFQIPARRNSNTCHSVRHAMLLAERHDARHRTSAPRPESLETSAYCFFLSRTSHRSDSLMLYLQWGGTFVNFHKSDICTPPSFF